MRGCSSKTIGAGELSFCMQARDMCPQHDSEGEVRGSSGSAVRACNIPNLHHFKTLKSHFDRGYPDKVLKLGLKFGVFWSLISERLETPSSRHAHLWRGLTSPLMQNESSLRSTAGELCPSTISKTPFKTIEFADFHGHCSPAVERRELSSCM